MKQTPRKQHVEQRVSIGVPESRHSETPFSVLLPAPAWAGLRDPKAFRGLGLGEQGAAVEMPGWLQEAQGSTCHRGQEALGRRGAATAISSNS